MKNKKRGLLNYTWPIFIELLLQLLVSNIDKIMVNSISDTAVSSITNATTVLDVLLITFTVISLAITILASQYMGKQDYQKISEVYALGIMITGALALVVSISLLLFGEAIFVMIQVPPECMQGSLDYLNITAWGLLFQGLYNAYVAIFRSQGWMKRSMFISILINGLNIIGNYLLIYGYGPIPPMGIGGAALSSVISRILGLVLMIYIYRQNSRIAIDFKCLRPWPSKLFKTMLYIGLPSGGESVSYSASQMVILSFINGFGNAIIKLRSFAYMFQMCAYMFANAISQAAQIIVGFAIGKKAYDEAHEDVKKTLMISVAISVSVTFLLYLFSDQVYGLFIKEAELLALAKTIMLIEIFLEGARAVNMTLVRCLQATGDTIYPTIVGILFMWGVATFLSYILGVVMGMGIVGMWIAMCLDESLRAVLFLIRWYRGKWRNRSVIEDSRA